MDRVVDEGAMDDCSMMRNRMQWVDTCAAYVWQEEEIINL